MPHKDRKTINPGNKYTGFTCRGALGKGSCVRRAIQAHTARTFK